MKKIILLLCVFPLIASNTLHKFYVSLTDIEFNKKQQSVQIITNVFMDDIEATLNDEFSIDAQISNPNEINNIDTYFYKYLQNHFHIKVNNQEKKYKFIGKEYEGNIVYLYLEIENIKNVESIEIQNTVLFKNFPDQQNLIKINVNNTKKSLLLTTENDKGLLNF